MNLQQVINELGRKALVDEVLGTPLRSYESPEAWLEAAHDSAMANLPDCLSWDQFTALFAGEIRTAWEVHETFHKLFPGYSLDDMAEDLESVFTIRRK